MSPLRSLPRALLLIALIANAADAISQQPLAIRAANLARVGGADEVEGAGYLGLAQALRDSNNDATVAIIASHPDDQYLLPAAYLRLHHGYRVTVIMMTRGEGGQNNFGSEVGDSLAALRSLETEECARSLGLRVHYLNRADDGYCRTASEAFESWGETRTIRELARAIRTIQPDILLTTHHPRDTHGHDLAVIESLPAAVALAADERQSLGSEPAHSVTRVYRGATPEEEPWFELPSDDVEPDRGLTYREIAYRALTRSHRSQSPFRAEDDFFRGAHRFVGIRAIAEPPRNFHAGLSDALLEVGKAGLLAPETTERLRTEFNSLQHAINNRPSLAARALTLLSELEAIDTASVNPLANRMRARKSALARVAMHAIGLRARVVPDRSLVAAGEAVALTVELSTAAPRSLTGFAIESADLELQDLVPADVDRPQPWRSTLVALVPFDAQDRDPLSDVFRRSQFRLPCQCELRFGLVGHQSRELSASVPIELPIAVQPPVDIDLAPESLLLSSGASTADFNLRIRRNQAVGTTEKLRFDLPAGVSVDPPEVEVDLSRVTELGFLFRLKLASDSRAGPQVVRALIGNRSRRMVVHRIEVEVDRTSRVGLIRGVHDSTRNVLSQLGCQLEILTEDVLPTRRLDDLDTILVDVRALNHHRAARANLNRLLQFASDGGRLVFLYHKDSEIDTAITGRRFWPPEREISIGRGRVTREDAPIEVSIPQHVLLNVPNTIGTEDWDGWSQERGLYFASNWHSGYETPLALRDPEGEIERGSLLFTRTGRGEYIYCALALHRQLENLHAGACRILANLVSFRRR